MKSRRSILHAVALILLIALVFYADSLSVQAPSPSSTTKSLDLTKEAGTTVVESLIAVSNVDDTVEIKRLVPTASQRNGIPESFSRLKQWRSWSLHVIDCIRTKLKETLPHPVDDEALSDLSFRLGVAADIGSMPCFGHPGGRAGYAVKYFCRARMLSDLIVESTEATSSSSSLTDTPTPNNNADAVAPTGDEKARFFFAETLTEMGLSPSMCVCSPIALTSIGGGPGYDFVAAALVSAFSCAAETRADASSKVKSRIEERVTKSAPIHATVFDYQAGWEDIVTCMSNAVRSSLPGGNMHHCVFGGTCDITLPLSHPVNAQCRAQVSNTDLWVCSYCVAENAKKLREKNFIFFHELFQNAKEESLFIFTETTHRLWPEFVDVALNSCGKGNKSEGFEIDFPVISRGKSTYQMVLKKQAGETMGHKQRELCNRFRRDAIMHERKIASGHQRQKKKVRGAK